MKIKISSKIPNNVVAGKLIPNVSTEADFDEFFSKGIVKVGKEEVLRRIERDAKEGFINYEVIKEEVKQTKTPEVKTDKDAGKSK